MWDSGYKHWIPLANLFTYCKLLRTVSAWFPDDGTFAIVVIVAEQGWGQCPCLMHRQRNCHTLVDYRIIINASNVWSRKNTAWCFWCRPDLVMNSITNTAHILYESYTHFIRKSIMQHKCHYQDFFIFSVALLFLVLHLKSEVKKSSKHGKQRQLNW